MREAERYERDTHGHFPLILNKPQLAQMQAEGADYSYMLVSTAPPQNAQVKDGVNANAEMLGFLCMLRERTDRVRRAEQARANA